jgi:methyl-accepting chemotaxis protein
MKISTKTTIIAVLPIILTAMVVFSIALYQNSQLRRFFDTEIDQQARSEAQKIAQSVYLMCRASQEATQQTVNANLRVAEDILGRSGTVSFASGTVAWDAVNQFTQKSRRVELQRMLIGRQWLGQNRDFSRPSPVVDDVVRLVGGTATIFQRMNESGDMLRVATSVRNQEGQRAIGTYIPAVNPDGNPNPVVAAVLRGETFRGRAFVVDDWYITAYQPIWDASGKRVVGALYVGVKQENLQSLRQGIMDIVVGKTGYVWSSAARGSSAAATSSPRGGCATAKTCLTKSTRRANPSSRRSSTRRSICTPPATGRPFRWPSIATPGRTPARRNCATSPWPWPISPRGTG